MKTLLQADPHEPAPVPLEKRLLGVFDDINALAEEYRDRCLWFLKPGFFAGTPEEAFRILDLIERYGDRSAFQRAGKLRKWLSLHIKAVS